MKQILLQRAPLKIAGGIVHFVAVNVVDRFLALWVGIKRLANCTMDLDFPRRVVGVEAKVAMTARARTQKPSRASNRAKVADLISLNPFNRLPSFFHVVPLVMSGSPHTGLASEAQGV